MNCQALFLCFEKQNNWKTTTGQKFRRGQKFRLTPVGYSWRKHCRLQCGQVFLWLELHLVKARAQATRCSPEMSTEQDRTGSGLKPYFPDQDWIGLQYFPKMVDQGWIGLRNFLFLCDYSENIKNFGCDPISRFAKWQCIKNTLIWRTYLMWQSYVQKTKAHWHARKILHKHSRGTQTSSKWSVN